ncbi:Uncharacterised protein [Mycobacterium tuberculosis]|nr:Uncharacterised protein [Mycobacterium tuberculosis]
MPQRRAGLGSNGKHGCDARNNKNVEISPVRGSFFDCLTDGSRHGENARIAAGDDADFSTCDGHLQRRPGAGQLLAVVRSVAALVGTKGEPIKIREIAKEILSSGNGRRCLRRHLLRITRAKPYHSQ